MKCQNCGNNEANFHYTSNINGHVTEQHLCEECAAKLGLTRELAHFSMNRRSLFGDLMSDFFDLRPMLSWAPFSFPFALPGLSDERKPSPEKESAASVKPEPDAEMKQRREINALREQMRAAVETENFEKAAELRDTIHRLEGQNQ